MEAADWRARPAAAAAAGIDVGAGARGVEGGEPQGLATGDKVTGTGGWKGAEALGQGAAVGESRDRGRGILECTGPLARKGGLTGLATGAARGVVVTASTEEAGLKGVTASTREGIRDGDTVTARGVVKAGAGPIMEAELGQGGPGDEGVALHILNMCNIKKMLLKR